MAPNVEVVNKSPHNRGSIVAVIGAAMNCACGEIQFIAGGDWTQITKRLHALGWSYQPLRGYQCPKCR